MAGNTHDWLWSQYETRARALGREPVALDFGCGQGKLISRALKAGLDSFHGAETYYGDESIAADAEASVPAKTQARIVIIGDDGRLPFPDEYFDFVCTSQVLEHVPDLPSVVDELARVTKPDGVHYHAFPTREAIVEGHVEIPLIHRLHGDRRRRWAQSRYRRGRAKFVENTESFEEWWGEMGPFLSERTFHRPWSEFEAAFMDRFTIRHVEKDKLAFHLNQRGGVVGRAEPAVRAVPRNVAAILERRRAGAAVELRPL